MEIYRANEAAYFPPNVSKDFASLLLERRALMLVAESNGRTVGCCGLQNYEVPVGQYVGV